MMRSLLLLVPARSSSLSAIPGEEQGFIRCLTFHGYGEWNMVRAVPRSLRYRRRHTFQRVSQRYCSTRKKHELHDFVHSSAPRALLYRRRVEYTSKSAPCLLTKEKCWTKNIPPCVFLALRCAEGGIQSILDFSLYPFHRSYRSERPPVQIKLQ